MSLNASLTFWPMADYFIKNSGTWVMNTIQIMNQAPWLFILKSAQCWNMLLLIGDKRMEVVMFMVRSDALGISSFSSRQNNSVKLCVFPSSPVRPALLHAHPVHRPCRRGGETLFHGAEVSGGHPAPALVPGILWRQLRGQGLSGLSHQT